MIQWRIYTEKKNVDNIITACTTLFPEWSISFYNGRGLWNGTLEDSLIVEYIGVLSDYDKIINLAQTIKICNEQQAVLVTGNLLQEYRLV